MDALRLPDDVIADRAADGSHERGRDYHEAKAVLSVVLHDGEARARVTGSRTHPYTVHLTPDPDMDEDLEATCSCPDDRPGWCKHTVAVLLALNRGDEEVEERPPLAAELEDLPRDELADLVRSLAGTRSGVRDLLEARWETHRALQQAHDGAGSVDLEPGPFRRRVLMLLHGGEAGTGHTYRRAARTRDGIDELLALVDRLTRGGAPEAGLEALEAMTEVYLEGWEKIHGLGGYPGDVVEALAARLAEALREADLADDEEERWVSRLDAWEDEVGPYGLRGVFDAARGAVGTGNERRQG